MSSSGPVLLAVVLEAEVDSAPLVVELPPDEPVELPSVVCAGAVVMVGVPKPGVSD